MSSEEKLVEAAARKDNGNAKFKAGKNELAVKKYKVRGGGVQVRCDRL